jgi:hypothetical protein
VTLKPGEALVFTEKMLHATAMWSSTCGPRKTLFYKYQPYGQSDAELQEGNYTIQYDLSSPYLTDDQRRILAWPEQWKEYYLCCIAATGICCTECESLYVGLLVALIAPALPHGAGTILGIMDREYKRRKVMECSRPDFRVLYRYRQRQTYLEMYVSGVKAASIVPSHCLPSPLALRWREPSWYWDQFASAPRQQPHGMASSAHALRFSKPVVLTHLPLSTRSWPAHMQTCNTK